MLFHLVCATPITIYFLDGSHSAVLSDPGAYLAAVAQRLQDAVGRPLQVEGWGESLVFLETTLGFTYGFPDVPLTVAKIFPYHDFPHKIFPTRNFPLTKVSPHASENFSSPRFPSRNYPTRNFPLTKLSPHACETFFLTTISHTKFSRHEIFPHTPEISPTKTSPTNFSPHLLYK